MGDESKNNDESWRDNYPVISERSWSTEDDNYSARLWLDPPRSEFSPATYFCSIFSGSTQQPLVVGDNEGDQVYDIQMWSAEIDAGGEVAKVYLEMVEELVRNYGLEGGLYFARLAGFNFAQAPGDIVLEPRVVEVGHTNFSGDAQSISEQMRVVGLTPAKYPRVVDLGAGSSPFYKAVLSGQGWEANNLTNIDIELPLPNPVPNSRWLSIDLGAFNRALCGGWPLPEECMELKHGFDFAVMTCGIDWGPERTLPTVGDFLVREGGVLYQNGLASRDLERSNLWSSVGDALGEEAYWINRAHGGKEWFDIIGEYHKKCFGQDVLEVVTD